MFTCYFVGRLLKLHHKRNQGRLLLWFKQDTLYLSHARNIPRHGTLADSTTRSDRHASNSGRGEYRDIAGVLRLDLPVSERGKWRA